MEKKTISEQILDWFERNPLAKMRSAPLAKAMKMDPSRAADALGRLVTGGQLMRVKVMIGESERTVGTPKEQWEYWLPLSGKAPAAVKPYVPPVTAHRVTPDLPSLAKSPIAAKAEIIAPQATAGVLEETEEIAKKVVHSAVDRESSPEEALTKATAMKWDEIAQMGEALAEWITVAGLLGINAPGELKQCFERAVFLKAEAEDAVRVAQKTNEDLQGWLNKERERADENYAEAERANSCLIRWIDAGKGQGVTDPDDLRGLIERLALRLEFVEGETIETKLGRILHENAMATTPTAVLETKTPAGYIVAAPSQPIKRFGKSHTAIAAALSAARSHSQAEVFALYPEGKAIRGAEWKPRA